MSKVAEVISHTTVVDARKEADTLRLWESYREQALLWRSLSLLQIPTTLIAVILALYMANTREITLNVPPKPLPGIYPVQELSDSIFLDAGTDAINLIASYQSRVARRQFAAAMEMFQEPLLSRFKEEIYGEELAAIETTDKTQIFFVDPTQTTVTRNKRNVTVTFVGDQLKIISGRQLPMDKMEYTLTMTTQPKNKFNQYGIVVTNINVREIKKR